MKKIKEYDFKKLFKTFKIKSKEYLKTNILFMTFVLCSLMNGCLIRFLTVKNFFDIRPMIADLAFILVFGALGYFIKPKHQFKYYFILSCVFVFLCIVNSMYYTNYLSFASFSLLETSLQVIDVGDAVVENVMEIKDFCYLWQIFAIIFIHRELKKKKYYLKVSKIENGRIRAVNTLLASVVLFGIFISTMSSIDISRFSKQWNREYIVMRFGIYTYQLNDLFATVKSQLNPLFGYDKNAKKFREYYENRNSDKKINEYTDIFKGKNLLLIHAESIQQFTLNTSFNGQDVAPNLKKMASEGLYFSNFYAQESVGTSSDSEFTLSTSLMPASSGTVFVSYWDRKYDTLQKQLKNNGYYTFSMHGNNCSFWNRENAHKSLGYDKFYCYNRDFKLDDTIGLGLSDKSFFSQASSKIKKISDKKTNFMGTLIMLTNHTPFTAIEKVSDYDVTTTYKKINPDTGIEEDVKVPYMEGTKLGSYFKSVHYADEALGQLMDQLDKNGVLDNTVIVIYGDHDAKLKKSEFKRFYNYDKETDSILDEDDPNYKEVDYYSYELNRKVPLIIWSKDMKKKAKEITKVMGMYDVFPTLANMFGLNTKYAIGHDIFSVDENVVFFPDGNWLTNKMYYNQSKEEGKLLNPDDTVSVDYIQKYTKQADQAVSISDAIIVYDLIKKENEKESLTGEVKNDKK